MEAVTLSIVHHSSMLLVINMDVAQGHMSYAPPKKETADTYVLTSIIFRLFWYSYSYYYILIKKVVARLTEHDDVTTTLMQMGLATMCCIGRRTCQGRPCLCIMFDEMFDFEFIAKLRAKNDAVYHNCILRYVFEQEVGWTLNLFNQMLIWEPLLAVKNISVLVVVLLRLFNDSQSVSM